MYILFSPHIIAVSVVHEDHQRDGDISFHVAREQDDFGLDLEAMQQQQEMQQMISKPHINNYLHLLFEEYIDSTMFTESFP